MFKRKYRENFHVGDELLRIKKNQHMFPVHIGGISSKPIKLFYGICFPVLLH